MDKKDKNNPPKKVVIYTTPYCPYCAAAKKLLKSKGVNFREIDVMDDAAMRDKLVHMSGGHETVPQIFIDDEPIGGYGDLVEYFKKQ